MVLLLKHVGTSNPEARRAWNEVRRFAVIVTKLIKYFEIEQECTTDVDFSEKERKLSSNFLSSC